MIGIQGSVILHEDEDSSQGLPLRDVASWFEANGTLLSCHHDLPRLQQQQQHSQRETGSRMENVWMDFPKEESQPEGKYDNPSTNQSWQPLITSTMNEPVQTSPIATVNVFALQLQQSTEQSQNAFLVETTTSHLNHTSKTCHCFMVSNCQGYWVSDYCGIGGFQQVLFFFNPKAASSSKKNGYGNMNVQRTVLTDGLDLWVPYTTSNDDSLEVKHATIACQCYHGKCLEVMMPSSVSNNDVMLTREHHLSLFQHTTDEVQPRPTTSSVEEATPSDSADSIEPWRTTMERALLHQYQQLEEQWDEQERLTKHRRLLLEKSQQAMQQTLVNNHKHSGNDNLNPREWTIQWTELRYRVYPRTSTQIGCTSACLWMEIDVRVVSDARNHDENGNKIVLWNSHVSCVVPSSKRIPTESPTNQSKAVGNISSTCQSGVVPALRIGDHVTVVVYVEIDGLFASVGGKSYSVSKEELELQLGVVGQTETSSATATKYADAYFLGNLMIPMNVLFQAAFVSKNPLYCCHSGNQQAQQPRIIYDCRAPHVIPLDVSRCIDFNVSKFLKVMNDQLLGTISPVHIDLATRTQVNEEKDRSTLSLVIFAAKKSELPGILSFLKVQLPKTANILQQ